MKTSNKKKLGLNVVVLIIIFGVMFYVIRNSLGDILYQLKDTPLIVLMGVTCLGMVYQFFEGWSIKTTVQSFSDHFRILDGSITSCYAAFTRVITFGAGTLLAEINYYRKKGLKVSQGVGATALHMIMYKSAILTYAVVGLIVQFPYLRQHFPSLIPFLFVGIIGTLVVILFFLFISVSVNLQVGLTIICDKIFHKQKFRDWVDQVNLQIYSLREAVFSVLKDRTAMMRIYALNLVKVAICYMIPYVCLYQDHPDLSFPLAFAMISFTLILSGVIPAPAGLGSFEFVYMLLLKPIVGTVDAASSMLLYRFASYVLPFLLGFIYVMHDRKNAITEEVEEIRQENDTQN